MAISNITNADDWYTKPLNFDDIIAGGTLILLAVIFLLIYILISFILYRKCHVITFFIYLLSVSINNMILLINYSLVPGFLIITKTRFPVSGRRICQIYFDTMWFSMCYHTALIAWSRYQAVCHPWRFRSQKNSTIYVLCFICYIVAFMQSMILYHLPWYVTFYYDASAYGMVTDDIELYLKGGKAQFFGIFHAIILTKTFIFYGCALYPLIKQKLQNRNNATIRSTSEVIEPKISRSIISNTSIFRAESRLILPCICNATVFLLSQMVIKIGIGEGHWTTWLILVLFTLTASVDSVTLLIFSKIVRDNVMVILRDLFSDTKTLVIEIKPSAIEIKNIRNRRISPKSGL
ncbi:Orexin receptor type [Dirofilaria immitis]